MDHKPLRPPSRPYRWLVAVTAALIVAFLAAAPWVSTGGKAGPVPKATVPPHLGWVPANADFFMHFRVADRWSGADGKVLRDGLPDLEQGLASFFESDIGLAPAEVETFTVVIPSFDGMFQPQRAERSFPRVEIEKGEGKSIRDKKSDENRFEGKKFDGDVHFREEFFTAAPLPRARVQRDEGPPEPVFIVTATQAAPVAKLRERVAGEADAQKHKGQTYYTAKPFRKGKFDGKEKFDDKDKGQVHFQERGREFYLRNAVYFADERTIIYGPVKFIQQGIERGKVTEVASPLAPALARATEKHHLVAGVHIDKKWAIPFLKTVSGYDRGQNHGLVHALAPLGEAPSGVLVADLGAQTTASLEFHFPDEKTVPAGMDALQDGLALLRILLVDHLLGQTEEMMENARDERGEQQVVFVKVLMQEIKPALRRATFKQQGSAIHTGAVVKTSLAAVQTQARTLWKQLDGDEKVKENRLRKRSQNNLQQIAIALHNYHGAHKVLPPHAICDKDGKPLLSWRVAILPYIEEENVYREFKLDEPWDSAHNKKLLERIPPIYAAVSGKARGTAQTYYQGFLGPDNGADATAWARRPGGPPYHARGVRLTDIRDGTSNTLLVVEAGEAVPWTKPDDLPYDAKKPLPKLGGQFTGGFNAAFCDGYVRFIRRDIPEATLRALITRSGGEAAFLDER